MTEVHPRVEASDRVERPQTPQRAEDDEPRSVSPAGIIPDQSASTKRGRSEETEAASESDKRQRPEVDIADSDSSRVSVRSSPTTALDDGAAAFTVLTWLDAIAMRWGGLTPGAQRGLRRPHCQPSYGCDGWAKSTYPGSRSHGSWTRSRLPSRCAV